MTKSSSPTLLSTSVEFAVVTADHVGRSPKLSGTLQSSDTVLWAQYRQGPGKSRYPNCRNQEIISVRQKIILVAQTKVDSRISVHGKKFAYSLVELPRRCF